MIYSENSFYRFKMLRRLFLQGPTKLSALDTPLVTITATQFHGFIIIMTEYCFVCAIFVAIVQHFS